MDNKLTLKQVSKGTGVPLNTIRTWVYQLKCLPSETAMVGKRMKRVVTEEDLANFLAKRNITYNGNR